MEIDVRRLYRAVVARDSRFDGRFFTAVITTGVYCRPICPAPTPRAEHVRFFPCAAAAEAAGFRPCRRCRPETAPGTPAWLGTSATVARALRLIGEGALDEGGVEDLAVRLGIGSRHLRRLFDEHLGASPLDVALTRRLHFARALLDQTDMPVTEIAFASGFGSVRRFYAAVVAGFGRPPRELRTAARPDGRPAGDTRPTGDARPAGVARSRAGGKRHADGRSWRLKVAYRPPYHWETTLAFLAARAVPGIEEVEDGAYRRSIRTDGGDGSPDGAPGGTIEVRDDTAARALAIEIRAGSSRELTRLVERVRRLFDLDADPLAIAAVLGSDPMLARSVAAHPGMRSMGAWDPFEYAIRAIIGQQVSIAAARRLAGRLVETYGTPLAWSLGTLRFLFPLPEDLARARLASIGIPQSRAEAIRKISRAVAEGLRLDASDGPELAIQRISALPGVGRWTAEMILIRGAGEPDVLPISDLGIRRAFPPDWTRARIEERSRAWSPWRSYAAMHIWMGGAEPHAAARPHTAAEPHAAVEKRTPARQPRADKARSGHSRRRKG